MRRVRTEQHGAILIVERAPPVAFRLERGQRRRLRDVAEAMTAALALGVFEIKDLATMLASKEFHPCRSVPGPRKSAGDAEWFRVNWPEVAAHSNAAADDLFPSSCPTSLA